MEKVLRGDQSILLDEYPNSRRLVLSFSTYAGTLGRPSDIGYQMNDSLDLSPILTIF